MAIQLLPILLIGGAAAVVVSQGKKSKKGKGSKSSNGVCPPLVTIGSGVANKAREEVTKLYGSNPDPAFGANHWMTRALPSSCSRSSVASTFNFELPVMGKRGVVTVRIPLTMPELYMSVFLVLLEERVGAGMIDEKRANAFLDREASWFKQTTGKPFDQPAFEARIEKAVNDALAK